MPCRKAIVALIGALVCLEARCAACRAGTASMKPVTVRIKAVLNVTFVNYGIKLDGEIFRSFPCGYLKL